jgi:hypothetical protein
MNKILSMGLLIGLWIAGAGCAYDLDIGGKACDSQHQCPTGYKCVLGNNGTDRICVAADWEDSHADGEDGGGGDDGGDPGDPGDGDGSCSEGQRQCKEDRTAVLECQEGGMVEQPCEAQQYCFDDTGGGGTVDCISECATKGNCQDFGSYYCNGVNHHCEVMGDCTPPNGLQCSIDGNKVEKCDSESGFWVTEAECTPNTQYCDRAKKVCKSWCHDDIVCREENQAPITCDLGTTICVDPGECTANCNASNPCRRDPDVEGDRGACVPTPTTACSVVSGSPLFTCYDNPTNPQPTPAACAIHGHVLMWNGASHTLTPTTVNLVVRVHLLEDALDGVLKDTHQVSASGDGSGNNYGSYSLTGIPTNTELVVEVQGGKPSTYEFVDTYTFGVYFRADDCQVAGNDITKDIVVLPKSSWDTFAQASGTITVDIKKGLMIGWLRDCNNKALQHGTVGISFPKDRLYYPTGYGTPYDLPDTSNSGFFVAANVLATRGVVAATVLDNSPRLLGAKAIRLFPNSVSMVYFEKPSHP